MLDQLGRDRFRQKREQIKKKEDEYVAFLNKYQHVRSILILGPHDVQQACTYPPNAKEVRFLEEDGQGGLRQDPEESGSRIADSDREQPQTDPLRSKP